MDGDDQIDVARPGPLRVEARRLGRMVWVAVVVADDVQARRVCFTLDADVVSWVDLVAVARAFDDDVARALDLGDLAITPRADHDAADLVRIPFGAVRADRFQCIAVNLHCCRPYRPVDR